MTTREFEQAALAAMLELMFVLGWHNPQTHDYLHGHHFDGLRLTLRPAEIGGSKDSLNVG